MAEIIKKLGDFWHWLWNSESIWSYIIFLILLFVIIKFIFLPGLSFVFGMGFNGLPLAIVESSSMDHNSLRACQSYDSQMNCLRETSYYEICGNQLNKSIFLNKENYWQTCGSWYDKNTNVTKEDFSLFRFSNGFRKGDIIIIFGKKNPEIGDVIIFRAGTGNPIIHRVISLNPLETKGDHNAEQLNGNNNFYRTDETNIQKEQIIGVAVARIPYIGWIKLAIVELYRKIF